MAVDVMVFVVVMVAVLLGIALLSGWASDQRGTWIPRFRGELSSGAVVLFGLLALAWLTLLLLGLAAAFVGTVGLARGEPGSGGLGFGALLVGLLGAPFLVWSTVIKQTTVNFQREGHITDRINKAVEQLGAEKTVKKAMKHADGSLVLENDEKPKTIELTEPNIEVRIGAILSLERIAQDSTRYDRGRDHVRVMEILCAYVRENAPARNLDATPTPFKTKKPRQDIQIALTVIKRRTAEQAEIEGEQRYRIDLRDTDLDGCDLSNGRLIGAWFRRSRLESTNFESADLTGADFSDCLMHFVDFHNAKLRGAILNRVDASRSNFWGSLTLAKLESIFIEGAKFPDLYISEKNYQSLFGSKDSEISSSQLAAKMRGLDFSEEFHLAQDAVTPDAHPAETRVLC